MISGLNFVPNLIHKELSWKKLLVDWITCSCLASHLPISLTIMLLSDYNLEE